MLKLYNENNIWWCKQGQRRETKLQPQVQLEPTKVQKAEQAENLKHLFLWSTTDELFSKHVFLGENGGHHMLAATKRRQHGHSR